MRLLYATSIDLPSTRANRLQIVSMSHAWAALLGGDFVLGLYRNKGEPLAFEAVELQERRSFLLAWRYLQLAKAKGVTHVYCREEKLLSFLMLYNRLFFRLPIRFVYELHHFWHEGWWYRALMHRVDDIVAITQGLKDVLVRQGYKSERILVAPDAVDIALFDVPASKEEVRRKLGLPADKKVAIYVGAIDEPWKGADIFYKTHEHLNEQDYLVVIAGGKPHYVEWFEEHFPPVPAVRMEGYIDYAKDFPLYLRAADVAVVPNSAKQEISRVSTSPLKVFAYMASGCPIVASDLPSIREVLNETNAVLVEPDSPEALATGIRKLAEDPGLALRLASKARQDVESYTWDKRAKGVLDFIA